VTQGGDWGYFLSRLLSHRYPSHVRACHLYTIRAYPPSITQHPLLYIRNLLTPLSPFERAGQSRTTWFETSGSAYGALHSTAPQTLSYALHSPLALLAWIYEKLHTWTDAYPWTDDEILTWISIYAFSRAGPHASIRIYYEAQHVDPGLRERLIRSWMPQPLGLSYFPKELQIGRLLWGRTLGKVVLERTYERGGHFAAWECPEEVVRDLREMCGRGGGAEGVVEGRCGFDG
jgi:pimeloyl-ACP methyl ester carboxylesterase